MHPTTHPVPAPQRDAEPRPTSGELRERLADDTGAQSMEYAALAAGGCGIVGILISLLQSEPVQSRLGQLITGLLEQLGTRLGGVLG